MEDVPPSKHYPSEGWSLSIVKCRAQVQQEGELQLKLESCHIVKDYIHKVRCTVLKQSESKLIWSCIEANERACYRDEGAGHPEVIGFQLDKAA